MYLFTEVVYVYKVVKCDGGSVYDEDFGRCLLGRDLKEELRGSTLPT